MFRTMIQWLKRRLLGTPVPPASSSAATVRRCEQCERPQILHITTVNRGGELSEAHLCEECARPVLMQPYPPDTKPVSRAEEVRVEVERVVISEIHDQQVIVLREVEGERRLPFVLGIFEALAVDRALKGVPSPRPLTYDAWLATVAALGAGVQAACIHEFREHTYFAEVRLHRGGELVRMDVRPSDALMLALKAGAPVLIADRLLAEASGAVQ
jgi:bifunctional DNase/RNase